MDKKIDIIQAIEDIQKGHIEQFEVILQSFDKKVRKTVAHMSTQEKEDLRQEIILKLFEKLKEYDLEQTPGFLEFLDQITNRPPT